MAFTYTVSKPNYDENSLLPGTAVNYTTGTVANGDFKEGNGIVVMCTPLVLEIELFELQTLSFERVSVPVEQFMDGTVELKVLTIEDGVGTEPTGAIPTDLTPPDEVGDLRVEHTDTSATLYWTNPTVDFHHAKLFRDGMLVDGNVTGTTIVQTMLAPDVTYIYTITTVDAAGNESTGREIEFTMNSLGDTTVNFVIAP